MPIQVDPDSTGKIVDTATVGLNERVIEVIGDPVDALAMAAVKNSAPTTEYGVVTRNIPSGTQPVSGTFFQGTQPVSAAALPLPAGASTEATLALIKAKTDNIDVLLSTRTKPADTQPISAAALPLPAGASTEATLSAASAKLPATLGQKTMAASMAVVVASDQTVIPVSDNAGSLTVDAPVGTPVFVRLSDGAAAQIGQKAMTASLPVVLASDQTVIPVNGDVDHDAANTLKNIQIAGHASPVDVPPAVVSANADRARIWVDRSGAQVARMRKLRESYTAVFRLAEAAARLDQTFTQVANTNKQWATLHHIVTATKEVRLQKCLVYITSDTVAGIQGVVELRQISAAPVTGNPAITPTPHRRGGTAAEAICLYLPTTAGTEAGVNSPLAHVPFDTGISGAVSTVNPVPILVPIVLYDASQEDPEVMQPVLPVATLDGWAVMVRTVGVPVLRITVVMKFTEEIP